MKELIIESKTHGRKIVLLDDEDYDRVIQCGKWSCIYSNRSHTFYATRHAKTTNRRLIYMHVFIMKSEPSKGEQIDHWDGNGLNNQRKNLRITDNKHNQMNRKTNKNSTTGYKGVVILDDCKNKYRASIRIDQKFHTIGYYFTAIEAALAYDEASIKYFGEYAKPNFPVKEEQKELIVE
jgi:hypothetical protein